jgi:hypothetical protein
MNAGIKVDGAVGQVKEKGVHIDTDGVWEEVVSWAVG